MARLGTIEPGEQQQVADDPFDAGLVGEHVLRRGRPISEVGPDQRSFQLHAHRRQWAAQLVRCVGSELALPRRRGREAVEQIVHRRAEADDLLGARRHAHSPPAAVGADRLQLGAHRLDRAERRAHAPPGDRPDEEDHQRQDGGEAHRPDGDGMVRRFEAGRDVHLERTIGPDRVDGDESEPAGRTTRQLVDRHAAIAIARQVAEACPGQRRRARGDDGAVDVDDLGDGEAIAGHQRSVDLRGLGHQPGDVLGAALGEILASLLDRRVEDGEQQSRQRGERDRDDHDGDRRHASAQRPQRPAPPDRGERDHAGAAMR